MTATNDDHVRNLQPRRSLAKHVGPLLAYVVYIFVSGTSTSSAPPMGVSDKTAHFVAFGLMVPLNVHAFRYSRWGLRHEVSVPAAVFVASGLGALLEFWQSFLPYRSCEFADWEADTLGAVLVGAIVWTVLHVAESRGRA